MQPNNFLRPGWTCHRLIMTTVAVGLTTIQLPAQEPPAVDPVESASEFDVLNQGPLHESFAELHNNDAVPGVVVPKEPPPPIDEVPPDRRPSGENVEWIPGYWAWDDEAEDYLWVSGIWRKTPPNRRWVPGAWAATEGGWQWTAGFWAAGSRVELEYLPEPPASVEAGPSSQGVDGQFYIPGSWQYQDDSYRWRPGYWSQAYDDWTWVPDRYIWTTQGCIYRSGYWDYPPIRRGVVYAPVRFHRTHYGRPYSPYHTIRFGTSFFTHLFVRPRYSHYYFGNYYGPRYRGRNFYPWVQTAGQARRYDPLYAYYRHGGGAQRNFLRDVRSWHQYFERNQQHRPARTLALQQNRPRSTNLNGMAVLAGDPLNLLDRQRVTTISRGARNSILEQSRRLAEIRDSRSQPNGRRGGRTPNLLLPERVDRNPRASNPRAGSTVRTNRPGSNGTRPNGTRPNLADSNGARSNNTRSSGDRQVERSRIPSGIRQPGVDPAAFRNRVRDRLDGLESRAALERAAEAGRNRLREARERLDTRSPGSVVTRTPGRVQPRTPSGLQTRARQLSPPSRQTPARTPAATGAANLRSRATRGLTAARNAAAGRTPSRSPTQLRRSTGPSRPALNPAPRATTRSPQRTPGRVSRAPAIQSGRASAASRGMSSRSRSAGPARSRSRNRDRP